MLSLNTNAIKTYQQIDNTIIPGREIEARVLNKAALKLKKCRDNWSASDTKDKLDEALKYNQRVWSIFQEELLIEDNPLPQKLKKDILALSIFIDKRIFDVMAYPSPEKLNIIIAINQNIAAGLKNSPIN